MKFTKTSLSGTAKDIARRVIHASDSQLLIPPKLSGQTLEIEELEKTGKYIGLFSSGTTDQPKCIWNTFENLQKNGLRTASAFNITKDHNLLMLAAPWHVAGLSWAIMGENLGCEYDFITTKKGEHLRWLDAIQESQPDYLLTIPAVLRALYDENWFVPNVIYGGYSMKHHELELLSPHCKMMYNGYGQTEAGGLIAYHKRKSTVVPEVNEHLCCGSPIEGCEIYCDGTLQDPALILIKTETAFTSNRYNTGDLGYKDQDDNLFVTGRATKAIRQK